MSDLVRTSVTLPRPLYDRLNDLLGNRGDANRSEFIRDLIRDRLVAEEWTNDEETLGTLTLLYDHHTRGLGDKLTDIQHTHHSEVLASTHLHLSHHLCAEVLMVRGKASTIRSIAAETGKLKGVLHATLSTSSLGEGLT